MRDPRRTPEVGGRHPSRGHPAPPHRQLGSTSNPMHARSSAHTAAKGGALRAQAFSAAGPDRGGRIARPRGPAIHRRYATPRVASDRVGREREGRAADARTQVRDHDARPLWAPVPGPARPGRRSGFHGSGGCGAGRDRGGSGQPGEGLRWSSRVIASTAAWVQVARSDRCKTVCLAVRAIVAGIVNRRSRSGEVGQSADRGLASDG